MNEGLTSEPASLPTHRARSLLARLQSTVLYLPGTGQPQGSRGGGRPSVLRMFVSGRAIFLLGLKTASQTPNSESGSLTKGESWPLLVVDTEGPGWAAVLGAPETQQRGCEWAAWFSFPSDRWWGLAGPVCWSAGFSGLERAAFEAALARETGVGVPAARRQGAFAL